MLRRFESRVYFALRTAMSVSTVDVPPPKGSSPVRASYQMTPIDQTSVGAPMRATIASTCSGDMYAGVPMRSPLTVSTLALRSLRGLAMPKSSTLGTSAPVLGSRCTRMFSGLTSRCTTDRSWAYARARITGKRSSAARAKGRGFSRLSTRARESPSRSSSTMKAPSSVASPGSMTSTMLGCLSSLPTRASRAKRSSVSEFCACRAPRILSATLRPVTSSRAA